MQKNSKKSGLALKPQRILLIRTDRIGDVVLTLPMIDVLNHNYPYAKIDFLVNERIYDLISDYPNINKVHTIEKVTASGIMRLSRENNYDLAVVVHPEFRIALGLFLGGVKHRLGTAYRWYSFLFNIKHYQHRKDSIKHELEYNLDLLIELNCIGLKQLKPVIKVKGNLYDKLKEKLLDEGADITREFIVVHIPSLGSAKVWSDDNFIELIKMILSDLMCEFNIILTGTYDDAAQVNRVVSNLPENKRVFTVLDLNLSELAALLKMASLFIGNSTGPIHIAAAVGTFVIGLYSPVKVESHLRWGPYTGKKKLFAPVEDDNTRDVMDDIEPGEVFSFVKNYMVRN